MTTTGSHERAPHPSEGGDTVHSAVHTPADPADPGANARPRGRPREDSPADAQSQPQSAPHLDDVEDAPDTTKGDGQGAAARFSPPDIWSTDRPALCDVWAYAARGDWTRENGAPRRAGQAYALLVAVPAVGAAYAVAWAAERPARLISVVVLIALLAQVPPLAWLI